MSDHQEEFNMPPPPEAPCHPVTPSPTRHKMPSLSALCATGYAFCNGCLRVCTNEIPGTGEYENPYRCPYCGSTRLRFYQPAFKSE